MFLMYYVNHFELQMCVKCTPKPRVVSEIQKIWQLANEFAK